MNNFKDAKYSIDGILEQMKDTYFFKYLTEPECGWVPWYYEDDKEIYNLQAYPHRTNRIYRNSYNEESLPITTLEDFMQYGEYPDNISWACGASRIVIWDDEDMSYVLKIARNDGCEEYNEKEVNVFKEAQKIGADEAFAWMECIYPAGSEVFGQKLLYGIYAMEYVYCDEDETSGSVSEAAWVDYCTESGVNIDDSEEREKFFDRFWSDYDYNDDTILDYALEKCWAADLGRKVIDLIDKFKINDLHDANWGRRTNNFFVIVDYGGW